MINISLRNCYFIIRFVIDFVILLMIKTNETIQNTTIENNVSVLKNGIKEVVNNKYLLKLMLTNAVLFSGIKLIEESHPEYSANIGISVFIIGIYTSLILLFCIIGSYIGSKVNREKYQFVLNLFGVIFSFLMTILLKFISISFMYIIIGVMIILFGILNLIARRKI